MSSKGKKSAATTPPESMEIFCCACGIKVAARLVRGSDVYPGRIDLDTLPFWRCDACRNYVGCHHKTKKWWQPLGVIPTPEIRNARKHIHALIDGYWKSGAIPRSRLYNAISQRLGWNYHTAAIRSIEEARRVYVMAREVIRELQNFTA